MLQININHVPDYINLARKSKNNILLIGNPGVGKSQVIESLRSPKCKITTMTGSSTIEEYVNGIPQVNQSTNTLEYIKQQWFKEMEDFAKENPDGEQILFLDEFNTADPQVLKTFLTILAERRIPTLNATIPDQVVIVAAMNPNDQNDTEKLIRPMASRFMVLEAVSTMDSYKRFLNGSIAPSAIDTYISETQNEITDEQKFALLDQIAEDEWNTYSEVGNKSYHEINPRSFTNFLRALSYISSPAKVCGQVSLAFLGKSLRWVENAEDLRKRRAEKIKNGTVFPTIDELRDMRTDTLNELLQNLSKPEYTGHAARTCRLEIKNVLRARADGSEQEPETKGEE